MRIQDQIAEEVAFLKQGDVFGEMGSLGKKTRNASARAFTDVEVLILDFDTTVQLSATLPSFDLAIGKKYLEREKINEDFTSEMDENSNDDFDNKSSKNG